MAILLAVTLPHLNQGDFRTDTAWYSAIGVQAWRADSWAHWWTPYAEHGVPYFNKPPLALWIHGLPLWTLGVELWIARLPSVLAAAIALFAAVRAARLGLSRLSAVTAGCVLALTYEYFRRTKEVSLDLWHTAFLFLAVMFMLTAAMGASPDASSPDSASPDSASSTSAKHANTPRNWHLWLLGGACIGLALLCKPLQGLLALPIVAIWGCFTRTVVSPRHLIVGLLLATAAALAVAAPWHISMAALHGSEFTGRYFGGEIGERLTGSLTQFDVEPQHWTFYLEKLFTTYWPWLAMVVAALALTLRESARANEPTTARAVPIDSADFSESPCRWHAVVLFALLWTLIWLAALTLFPDRRDRYALVLWPALAIVAAALVDTRWFILDRNGRTRAALAGLLRNAPWLAAIAGAAFALAPVRVQRGIDPQWPALFDFLNDESLRGRTILAGGIDGNMSARLYLEKGWWPTPVPDQSQPPPGSILLYHKRGDRSPGPGEITIFRNRDLWMTRLESPLWHPNAGGAGWD